MPKTDMTSRAQPAPLPPHAPDAKDDIIYRITHDLGAGMRSLVLLSSWIAEDIENAGLALPPEAQANIELLKARGARLQTLMTDLLAYARIGQNSQVFDGDWAGLLDHIRKGVAGIDAYSITADLQAFPRIGTDDLQLLLGAMVSNAVMHHDKVSGHIQISAVRVGATIELGVTDDGPGIPKKQRIHLCKPLTSLRVSNGAEGSGMGLAIASKVAECYGGTLRISDAPEDRGCQVVVAFPSPTKTGASV